MCIIHILNMERSYYSVYPIFFLISLSHKISTETLKRALNHR